MEFRKTPKQVEAVKILSRNKYTALYGGSRSGKTFILVRSIVVRASKCKSRHLIIRQTFNAVKRSVFMDTLPKVMTICFPHLSYRVNKSDLIVYLSNGSEIHLAGMDNGKAVEKILGTEFSTIYFNEASEMEYSPTQLVLSRLAEKTPLAKRVWYDFNPPNKTHWSYWLFMKRLNPIDEEPLLNAEQYDYLLMNPGDNLDNIDPEYIKLLESMPEAERKRFLLGQYSDESDGQVYYAFDREVHVCDKIKKGNGQIYIGMDFNVEPMTAILAQVVNNEYHIFDEVFLNNSDTFKMVNELKNRGYYGTVIPDSTGKNRKTSGKSDHLILKEAGYQIPPVRNPFVTDRVNNVNRLFTANKIKINPRCKKLINDLEKVAWKNNQLDQKTNPSLTHISDALGYFLWWASPLKPQTTTKGIIFE